MAAANRVMSLMPPAMSWMSRRVFHPLWDLKDGSRRLRILRELERTQWLPPATLKARQEQRLKQLLRYAATYSPYYERMFHQYRFDPDQCDAAAFANLPLLTKSIIRSSTDQILSREFERGALGVHRTGGSTGVALTTYFDRRWSEIRAADTLRADQWAGCLYGMKIASLWGNPRLPKTFKQRVRASLIDRFVYLDTIDLNDRTIENFITRWRREGPEILFGHSHSLYLFACYLIAHGIKDLRPRGIISTSMMLLANERVVIESAFACSVTDRYGSEEVALIACECERHQGLHLNIEHLYIEFLREDGIVAEPGEEGAIVITDLYNHGMPFIRYRIEDVGVPTDRCCACGRGLPLMERVIGRVADYLRRMDGSLVAGVSLVERTLTAIPGIEQLQVVQPSPEEILLNVVRARDFTPATEQALLAEFRAVFGAGISIRADYMDRIPQERSGKYRFAICRI
jgi:phenylacetate-CoA ligase